MAKHQKHHVDQSVTSESQVTHVVTSGHVRRNDAAPVPNDGTAPIFLRERLHDHEHRSTTRESASSDVGNGPWEAKDGAMRASQSNHRRSSRRPLRQGGRITHPLHVRVFAIVMSVLFMFSGIDTRAIAEVYAETVPNGVAGTEAEQPTQGADGEGLSPGGVTTPDDGQGAADDDTGELPANGGQEGTDSGEEDAPAESAPSEAEQPAANSTGESNDTQPSEAKPADSQSEEKKSEEKKSEEAKAAQLSEAPQGVDPKLADNLDFSGLRLLIEGIKVEDFTPDTQVLGEYQGLFLTQYATQNEARNAYLCWYTAARGGTKAGTTGRSLRMEAYEIVVLPKGSQPPSTSVQIANNNFFMGTGVAG